MASIIVSQEDEDNEVAKAFLKQMVDMTYKVKVENKIKDEDQKKFAGWQQLFDKLNSDKQ